MALAAARGRGFIGGPGIEAHLRQAGALAEAVGPAPASVLDLGSGGGLPGLVLADRWPGAAVTLLDGSRERASFLADVVSSSGWGDRVAVAAGRAEVLGHGPLRATFELVVARSFGPPAVVAECAAPFLADGGRLVVSEPPGSDGSRWAHPEALALVGLEAEARRTVDGYGFQILRRALPCPARYPRRVGIPSKRPLF